MSQKAWMQAYTKGSKSLQARLAKIHANNPEFQDFVKKHGFGGNLSKKQSELQKKTSVGTVKPVDQAHPEMKKGIDREALIKAAAEKVRNRRAAAANRVAFGGELGGGFALHNLGFRTYRESKDLYAAVQHKTNKIVKLGSKRAIRDFNLLRGDTMLVGAKPHQKVGDYHRKTYTKEELRVGDKVRLKKDWAGSEHRNTVFTVHHKNADGDYWIGHGPDKRGWYVGDHQVAKVKSVREDAMPGIKYKDAEYTMRRGGWVVKRNGKTISAILPTDDHAKAFINSTRKSLGQKVGEVVRRKAKEIARGMGRYTMTEPMATESRENRERILAYDSAITTSKPISYKPKKTAKGKLKALLKQLKFTPTKVTENTEMSDTLNELRKATLASYLSKAGSRVRSGTKLGHDFEAEKYKHMAVANKHHPNMVTPGFEKDPEKLAHAEKNMKAAGDLEATFKRDAANRIKGIARAGRLLAKEEIEPINEKNTESHPSLWDTHELRHESGKVLKKGDVVKDFRGDKHKIKGFELPHHSGSTGRVYTNQGSFFPSVVDAKIVRKKGVKEEAEQVNEVSRSTIAKVAQARYNQAQAALKKKDFGGYVNKMKKAIKAGDATTPKTGWSAEDDNVVKREEVEQPVVSAQEKYRQIREAKARKSLRGYGPPPEEPKKKMKNFYNPDAEGVKPKKRMTMADLPADVKLHGD